MTIICSGRSSIYIHRLLLLLVLVFLQCPTVLGQWPPAARDSLRVTRSGALQSRPDIAVDNNGVVLVWQENLSTASVFAQRVGAQGKLQWPDLGLPVKVENADSPKVVSCGDDTVIIVWREYKTTGSQFAAMRYTLAGDWLWPAPVIFNSQNPATFLISIVPDGDGGVVAVLTTVDREMWAHRLDMEGNLVWGAGGRLLAQLTPYARMAVSEDGAGGAHITWDNYFTREELSERRSYVQHVDGAGAARFGPDGMQVSAVSANQGFSVSVADGDGGAYVLWYDGRTSATIGWDMYVQRLDADGGRRWGEDDVQITTGTGRVGAYPAQFEPCIADDGFGGALMAWGDYRNGIGADIYVQRLAPDGSALWQAGGTSVTVATQVDGTNMPMIVPDGTGGAIVAWRTGNGIVPQMIRAQRISADGAAVWAPEGIVVADTHGNRYVEEARLISDSAGGAYVTWRGSNTTSNNFVVYIARIYANGALAPAASVGEWMDFGN